VLQHASRGVCALTNRLFYGYNRQKGSREKIKSRFAFPRRLDLAAYCEDAATVEGAVSGGGGASCSSTDGGASSGGNSAYMLYSVVIHAGSAGSGHYTALCNDLRGEGVWEVADAAINTADMSEAAEDAEDDWTTVVSYAKSCSSMGSIRASAGGATVGDGGVGSDMVGVGEGGAGDGAAQTPVPNRWFDMNDEHAKCVDETHLEKAYNGERCGYVPCPLFFLISQQRFLGTRGCFWIIHLLLW
jgi:hypothetical protein